MWENKQVDLKWKAFSTLCAFLQKMMSIKRIYILEMLMFCYLIPDRIQIVLLNFCFLFISWRQDKKYILLRINPLGDLNLNFLSKMKYGGKASLQLSWPVWSEVCWNGRLLLNN